MPHADLDLDDDDDTQLDGDTPLSPEERRRVRKLLRDDDRATWARKQIRVVTPWIVGTVGALWAAGDWLSKHVKWGG